LIPHRRQLTISGLLLVVALLACVFNGLRPITRLEAIRIATNHFRRMPSPGVRPDYNVRAFQMESGGGQVWVVDFDDPATGEPFAQVSLDRHGRRLGTIRAD
jgi:hypothetical protein